MTIERTKLANEDRETIDLALRLIRERPASRKWYLLEGESCPDAFIQTDTIVLVVEGKRTERTCTESTKWMDSRSQILRHMDAALEIAGHRKVLGLLIAEGPKTNKGLRPSKHWSDQEKAQTTQAMIESSLPHRTAEQQALIAGGFLGVTTWQAVCSKLGLGWPLVPDAA